VPGPTRLEARTHIADYIELFYNAHRLHSFLGCRTPNEWEKEFMLNGAKAA